LETFDAFEFLISLATGLLFVFGLTYELFGHVVRMPDESDAKQILTASPLENWRRPAGRPRTTWMKTTQQDLKSVNLSLNVMKQLTWLRIIHSGD